MDIFLEFQFSENKASCPRHFAYLAGLLDYSEQDEYNGINEQKNCHLLGFLVRSILQGIVDGLIVIHDNLIVLPDNDAGEYLDDAIKVMVETIKSSKENAAMSGTVLMIDEDEQLLEDEKDDSEHDHTVVSF